MNKQWSSEAIHLPEGVCVDVHASREGVVLGVLVGMVLSADVHMTADKAREVAKAITEGAARSDAMKKGE